MVLLEWHKPIWPRPSRPSPRSLSACGQSRGAEVLYGGVDSSDRRRGEVGPWVGEMADEVGDSIWPPVKEEDHRRVVSLGHNSAGGERR
jgi:hypothetical protein